MLEVILDSTITVIILTTILMMLTSPAWITGKVIARQNRVLPVPFFFRAKAMRWTLWYLSGITVLVGLVMATRPIGALETGTRVVLALIAIAALVTAMISAFYIGWTSSAKRLARKNDSASAPPPVVPGFAQEVPNEWSHEAGQPEATQPVPTEYAPARPCQDDEYRPATPQDS